ncbi:MAG: DsbA family protein [Patescibacteria group bacterium]|nr:DsbA family protein [Patescibacteria group bacterium]
MNQPSEQPITRRERREIERQDRKGTQLTAQRKPKKMLLWGGLVLAVCLGITGILFATKKTDGQKPSVQTIADSDNVKGARNARAILIEYSDFQCPACSARYFLIKKAQEEYGDKVAFVFRHFPLKNIHPNAEPAARAAEAANKQDKFWEMHDFLFEKQSDWSSENDPSSKFISYAKSLGLDSQKFQTDYASDEIKKIVDEAYKNGQKIPIRGTPTYYLNGKFLNPFQSYSELKQALDEALK